MSPRLLARLRAPVRLRPRVLLAGATAAVLTTLAGPAPSAGAHPFGPPSTAEVSVQGSRLVIAWNTDKLDWVTLGESLGVFDGQKSGGSFEQRLQHSTAVRDYLLEHITVGQGRRPCHGTVLGAMEEFLARGAQVAFDCPAPVVEADVTIGALTDLHPAYRTMLTSEGPAEPQQTLFTSSQPTRHVQFTASGGSVRRTVVVFSAGTVVAALAIGLFVLRRSRRRKAARFGSTRNSGNGIPAMSAAVPAQGPRPEAVTTADTGTGSRSSA
ncbi:hypothetical protein [Streptomyces odonnellii]|uniref:hypothetical protein n=1 Tax=Streptomyces odonnellii TaxID=1417980 RepID=UPI0012FEADF0|nr:hypothetical protein [Streptomyces odonnellii]